MATMRTINLIKTKTGISPQVEILETVLKKISVGSLIAFLLSSVAVGSVFFYLQSRKAELGGEEQTLSQTITRNTNKEGLVFAIHGRVSLVDKIAGAQKSIGPLFDTVAAIVSPTHLSSFTFDDHNEAVLTIHVTSIDDAVAVAESLLKAVEAKQAKSPKLLSLSLARDGSIEISLSFIAVL